MVWAVAERGSTHNGDKDGWLLDCSGMSADCWTLWGVEFSGCCAEMVAYGEGKKWHNLSGDNRSFWTQVWLGTHGEVAIHPHPDLRRTWRCGGMCSPAARVNQHVTVRTVCLDGPLSRVAWCVELRGLQVNISRHNAAFSSDRDVDGLPLLRVSVTEPVVRRSFEWQFLIFFWRIAAFLPFTVRHHLCTETTEFHTS
jgi:hypothetical protein